MPRSSRHATDREGRATARPSTGDANRLACNRLPASVRRVVVEDVGPAVDGGRFPIKRTIGELVEVVATAFADGHERLMVVVEDRHADAGVWRETPMVAVGPGVDRWTARFGVDAVGWHEYRIAAWIDRFGSWRHDLELKFAAGQDVSLELLEGSLMIREAAARAGDAVGDPQDAGWLTAQADKLSGFGSVDDRVASALADKLQAAMTASRIGHARAGLRSFRCGWTASVRGSAPGTRCFRDRPARTQSERHVSRSDDEAAGDRRPRVRRAVSAADSPDRGQLPEGTRTTGWSPSRAIPAAPGPSGPKQGGHTAIDPGLGTFDDFHAFRDLAGRLGLEIALDLAWQCSPDHPWVREHPDWFRHRPDGTIKYAENPPKRYQDIYPSRLRVRRLGCALVRAA